MPTDDHPELAAVRAAIDAGGGAWHAEATPLFQLSAAQKRRRLGAIPPHTTMVAREELARSRAAEPGAADQNADTPAAFDWRNAGGHNFVTPIRDQGACGSCVAFGTSATVEATALVTYGPALAIDVSEAQLFYCVGAAKGASCGGGWWPDEAFQAFENPGITDEAHFPYTAGDQSCGLASGWQNTVSKLTGWHTVSDTAQMKAWISTRGPLTACFTVYEDFYAYSSGVYSHLSGGVVGGHCVSIVGYDDGQGCWIAKNSWGTSFGESGFFRIAYGQCGIEAEMWAADQVLVPSSSTVPLYRYWNSSISDHFYTTNWAELGGGNYGWAFEDTQCYVYAAAQSGTVALYRYWNSTVGDHFYTTNWNELGSGAHGWAYEGIQCYVYPGAGHLNAALYRYWSPGGTDHFYTTNFDELGAGNYGWHLELTQCFVPAGPGSTAGGAQTAERPSTFVRQPEATPARAAGSDAPATFSTPLQPVSVGASS